MATPLTDSINALTTYANEVTGASDTTLSDAVHTLANGYGGSATLITKTIIANGTYSASDDSADGYSEVTVNVPTGGVSSWTKVAETSYQISTTNATAVTVETWATGHSEIWTAEKYVFIRIRDTAGKRNGYFYGCDCFFINETALATGNDCLNMNGSCFHYNESTFGSRSIYRTNGFGVYADHIYSDGGIRIRTRYNTTNSYTIDGTYKVEVYLLDPAGGVPIFE